MQKVADYALLPLPLLTASTDEGRSVSGSVTGMKVYCRRFTDEECWSQPHFSSACSACLHQP